MFKFPEEPERDFIKRTIGLPGDTIELKNQTVFVNGQPLVEPYAHYLFPPADETQTDGFDLRRKYGPVTVPEGHYFMMGDNRDDSQDSRFWGFLPQSYVKGRALFIYWSFDVPDDGSAPVLRPVGKAIPPDSLTEKKGDQHEDHPQDCHRAVRLTACSTPAGRRSTTTVRGRGARGLLFDPHASDARSSTW